VVLTVSEILVSVTGLEFAYTQAPLRMKGTIMSLWLLTTFLGNFVVVVVKKLGLVHGTTEFLFWAGLTYLAALCFALIARRYVVRDHYLPEVAPIPTSAPAAGATPRLA
jgi:POT family proton-dependent oligopeptide transporter